MLFSDEQYLEINSTFKYVSRMLMQFRLYNIPTYVRFR
jgi:hypothetical protein